VQDAQLTIAARRLHARLSPRRTVAHHVEAAAAALAARLSPLTFFAHTALGPELPTYLPEAARRLAGRAGDALDVTLARRADAVAAVSTGRPESSGRRGMKGDHASRETSRGRASSSKSMRALVPVPWTVPPAIEPDERAKARRRFGFDAVAPVFLYAGNLDGYQGVEQLAEAFAIVRRRRDDARLLVATASDPDPLEKALWAAGLVEHARFAPLADEPDRRMAHAAADAAWVPRAAPGGLPMKLLDALARGLPTVATRRATGGLDLSGAAMVAADDDPEALAAAALLVLEGREAAAALGRAGVDFVRREHAPERYLVEMDRD